MSICRFWRWTDKFLYTEMRYLGGKYYVANHLAKHINGYPGSVFLEPFMGSCWVTVKAQYKHRLIGDLHDELVTLYHKATHEGWQPPEFISKSEYEDIRANKTNGKYPPELVAFAGFGCAFGGSYFRKYAGELHAARSKRSILKKSQQMKDVRFFSADYRELNPKGCVIYCDPPYDGCYSFRITGVRGNGSFDSQEFWEIMDKWAENNLVLVSELNYSEKSKGWECIMDVPIKASMRTKEGCVVRHERLFRKGNPCLVQEDEIDALNILGVDRDWKGFK